MTDEKEARAYEIVQHQRRSRISMQNGYLLRDKKERRPGYDSGK